MFRACWYCTHVHVLNRFVRIKKSSNSSPGAATWRTRRNIHVVFDSGLFALLGENMTSCTKPEVQNESHCSQSNDRVTAIDNMCRKLSEIWTSTFLRHDSRQTDRHADHNTSHRHWVRSSLYNIFRIQYNTIQYNTVQIKTSVVHYICIQIK